MVVTTWPRRKARKGRDDKNKTKKTKKDMLSLGWFTHIFVFPLFSLYSLFLFSILLYFCLFLFLLSAAFTRSSLSLPSVFTFDLLVYWSDVGLCFSQIELFVRKTPLWLKKYGPASQREKKYTVTFNNSTKIIFCVTQRTMRKSLNCLIYLDWSILFVCYDNVTADRFCFLHR